MKNLIILFLVVIVSLSLKAQTTYFSLDSTAAAFENNRLYFPFNNRGIIGDVNLPPKGRDVRYDSINVIFAGGFALSGFDSNDSLWANGVMNSDLVADYLPGNVNTEPDNPRNKIYSVSSSDSDFGENWQNWKYAVEQGAYFYDGDGDGVYNPVDLNGNGQWDTNEDRPDLLYDLTLFNVFNDGLPGEQRRYRSINPLGIEIRKTVFISNRNSILDDVVFIRYSIVSTETTLNNVLFSFWNDVDIGDASSDLFGSDTMLNSVFYYNNGEDAVYGHNPPSVFTTIVQGPIIESPGDVAVLKYGPFIGQEIIPDYKNIGMTYASGHFKGDAWVGYPQSPKELRNYQIALTRLGEQLDPCTFSYGTYEGDGCESANPNFWFSGDPVSNTGWLDTKPLDIRAFTTTGLFTLQENNPVDIIVAYVVGRGIDHLNSIDRAREITRYVHEEYERNFSTLVSVENKQEELPAQFYLSQNYPNPFNPTTKIKYTIPGVGDENFRPLQAQLIVYDILGREVKTLLNEVKAPGTYEITFNASQLVSGVYLYRLTSGSFSQTKKMTFLK